MIQHAMVHAAVMSQSNLWSFEDEVWDRLSEHDIRAIPVNFEHSIAWMIWHITRIEDITMNILVADAPQLLLKDGWYERLRPPYIDTGNAMSQAQITDLSNQINIDALREYRIATGRNTRRLVDQLTSIDMTKKVSVKRLQRIIGDGAVVEAAKGLLDYWGGLTIGGLLLMPPTRHPFVHLNEAMRVKNNLKRKQISIG